MDGGSEPVPSTAARTSHPAERYLKLFSHDEAQLVSQVYDAIRARRIPFIQQWCDLTATHLGTHRAGSELLFQETYVPYLRGAVLRLAAGDADGFVTFSGILGEYLANTKVPFAVLVAHLNFLKESCLKTLGDEPGLLSHTMLATIDKLTACCTSAAADSYYREVGSAQPRPAAPGREPTAERSNSRIPVTDAFHGIVGRSPLMQQVRAQIKRVAASMVPVLLTGETGTGKELIARAIHGSGPRHAAPFVAVNCAALPRDLIESELFGYKRGAFSGAVCDHLGLFRVATGGTLLLDEITEMSSDLQAKLLRVLQERSVRPVGCVTEIPVDVCIIASSNSAPEAALASGVLRPDLYYRLSVSKIVVPPLRARREDIPLLVEHCLAQLNERYNRTVVGVRGVTADAMDSLCHLAWPGNVRELFNVLEDAFTSCRALHIGLEELPLPAELACTAADGCCDKVTTLEESERALIEQALATSAGNKLRAAQRLGISRKKLYAKIAKYGLSCSSATVSGFEAGSRTGRRNGHGSGRISVHGRTR